MKTRVRRSEAPRSIGWLTPEGLTCRQHYEKYHESIWHHRNPYCGGAWKQTMYGIDLPNLHCGKRSFDLWPGSSERAYEQCLTDRNTDYQEFLRKRIEESERSKREKEVTQHELIREREAEQAKRDAADLVTRAEAEKEAYGTGIESALGVDPKWLVIGLAGVVILRMFR